MGQLVYKRIALGDDNDLIIPTSFPQYKLGEIIQLIDKEVANPEVIAEFIYIKNIEDFDNHEVAIIGKTTEIDDEISLTEPLGAQTLPIALVGIPQIVIGSDVYGFVQIKGNALAIVTGNPSPISIGDPLHLGFGILDQLQGGGNLSHTVAFALADLASGVNLDFPILMLGDKVAIPAA